MDGWMGGSGWWDGSTSVNGVRNVASGWFLEARMTERRLRRATRQRSMTYHLSDTALSLEGGQINETLFKIQSFVKRLKH